MVQENAVYVGKEISDLENVLMYSYSGYSGWLCTQFNMFGRLGKSLLWKRFPIHSLEL